MRRSQFVPVVAALIAILAGGLFLVLSPRIRLFTRSGAFSRPTLGESRDPDYAAFLEGVRRLTPPDARISLVLPSDSKAYLSEATSRLAPRRVFLGRENEASFVAAYRYQYREMSNRDVTRVPNGALFRGQVTARQ